jgi:hypothetical protein
MLGMGAGMDSEKHRGESTHIAATALLSTVYHFGYSSPVLLITNNLQAKSLAGRASRSPSSSPSWLCTFISSPSAAYQLSSSSKSEPTSDLGICLRIRFHHHYTTNLPLPNIICRVITNHTSVQTWQDVSDNPSTSSLSKAISTPTFRRSRRRSMSSR